MRGKHQCCTEQAPEWSDLDMLYEYEHPITREREVIDHRTLQRYWSEIEAGTRPGPMTNASPPGVVSGMSDTEALALARRSGALNE